MSSNKNKKESKKIRKMTGGDLYNVYPPTTDENNTEQMSTNESSIVEPMNTDTNTVRNNVEVLTENDIFASTNNYQKKNLNNMEMFGGKKIKRKSNKKQTSPKKSVKQRVSKNKRKSKNNKN